MPAKLDLTGQTFGLLTAIKTAKHRDRRGRILWQCRCECGGKKNVATADLKTLSVKSCGCLCRVDLTGRVFGRLVVIRETKQKKNNRYLWECMCECGNSVLLRRDALTSLTTQSCGCYNCQWSTCKENSRNTSRTRWFEIDGVTKCLAEWCEDFNMPYHLVYGRIARGWDLIDALTKEKRKSK